jgi:hypothetical protein
MNNYNLSEVLTSIQEDQVFKATFADVEWYITKIAGFIWYCDKNGNPVRNRSAVPLTLSNLEASYQLM